jgi:endonuclease/exonuclease/phosphatase family metal-dependent hydrolase
MRALRIALLASVIIAAACDQTKPIGPDEDPLFKSDAGRGEGQFARVMSRNLYIGTNISVVLEAPTQQLVPVFVWQAHAEVIRSRPEERMARIADEIAAARPDLVGLQEVMQFFTQTPGDVLVGNPQQANDLQFDFLQLLLDALAARGAAYTVAVVTENIDIELPAFDAAQGILYDLRVIDRTAVLARRGVQLSNASSVNFRVFLPVELGGVQMSFRRGFSAVNAKVRGRTFRFVNVHLETQDFAQINVAQGLELVDSVKGWAGLPVVLVGDFNSAANPSAPEDRKTATYGNLIDAGLVDAWLAANPAEEGLTCCHRRDLLNTTDEFDQRIDFVFFTRPFRGTGEMYRVGHELSDRTASQRWPSDHAGLVGQIRLP